MIDEFCAEYSWPYEDVLKRTYFQLTYLRAQIAARRFEERKIQLRLHNAANNANPQQYNEFLRSIEPRSDLKAIKKSPIILPTDGFSYRKET